MKADRPYCDEACDQNKGPILEVLRRFFVRPGRIVEIGGGTGQHAVHFARALPHLDWQATDVADHLPGMRLWFDEVELPNLRPPLTLDVCQELWPVARADGVFSANTAHIMSWDAVGCLFRGVGRLLGGGGIFCLYGPFNYGGQHTSPSNAQFDRWLRSRDPESGVRDFADLDGLAQAEGLRLLSDCPMPVNNRTLVWSRE